MPSGCISSCLARLCDPDSGSQSAAPTPRTPPGLSSACPRVLITAGKRNVVLPKNTERRLGGVAISAVGEITEHAENDNCGA